MQLAEGADIFAVMQLLGHSQISLTANTYGHMTKKLGAGTAARMDRALKPDTKTTGVDTKTDTKRDGTERERMQ
jgi:hypothetical protein